MAITKLLWGLTKLYPTENILHKFSYKRTVLPIAILSLFSLSCSKGNQPKCTDTNVQELLKEICAKDYTRDTSEISLTSVRTVSTNDEFNSCECAATVKAEAKTFSFLYLQKVDEDVEYTAQITDDGKEITVKVH